MKKQIIISIAFIVVLISGCSKDFLDTEPMGLSFDETYYSTEEEVFKGLNAAYDFLVRDYAADNDQAYGKGYASSYMMRNIASDDGNAGGGNAQDITDWQEMDEFRVLPQNGSLLSHWQRSYYGIFRCNQLIEREYDEPTDLILQYVAEAKFLRAYFHWELVTFFGEVPIVDYVITTADPYPPVNTVEEVYSFIEQDLLDAIDVLPAKSQQNFADYHRASKGAAQAFLAKVFMFQEKYTEASSLFNDLITSNEYRLDTDYAHIFSVAGEFGPESIFEISYSRNFGSDWEANRSRAFEGNVNSQLMGVRALSSNPYYHAGWGFNKTELSLIAAFDAENDSIRKYNSAYGDELFSSIGASYSDPFKNTGWWCKKMAPDAESYSDGIGAAELDYDHNEIVMRLADMYLLYAEAQYRLGNESITRQYIDSIRLRVDLPPINPSLSGQSLFDALVKERRLELANEGHRYFDLIRWGLAEQVLQNQWGGSYNPDKRYFPYPQQEIDRSGGVLKQNPSYL